MTQISADPAEGAAQPLNHVLQNANYRHFLASRTLSSLAFQSLAVALGWMIYDLTGSAYMLGWVGFFQFLPMLLLTFVVGSVADRYDRRRIGLICQWVEATTVLVLGVLVWHGALTASGILIAVSVLGAAQAFERPTMASLVPGIVGPSMLQRAIATSTSFMQTALIVGPSTCGWSCDHRLPSGPTTVSVANCVCSGSLNFTVARSGPEVSDAPSAGLLSVTYACAPATPAPPRPASDADDAREHVEIP